MKGWSVEYIDKNKKPFFSRNFVSVESEKTSFPTKVLNQSFLPTFLLLGIGLNNGFKNLSNNLVFRGVFNTPRKRVS